jgi:hypothetical protein
MIDDDDCGAVGGVRIGRGNRSTRRKPAPVPVRPPQINPTWPDRDSNPGRSGGKPATNRLSYGTPNILSYITLHYNLWHVTLHYNCASLWKFRFDWSWTFSVKMSASDRVSDVITIKLVTLITPSCVTSWNVTQIPEVKTSSIPFWLSNYYMPLARNAQNEHIIEVYLSVLIFSVQIVISILILYGTFLFRI